MIHEAAQGSSWNVSTLSWKSITATHRRASGKPREKWTYSRVNVSRKCLILVQFALDHSYITIQKMKHLQNCKMYMHIFFLHLICSFKAPPHHRFLWVWVGSDGWWHCELGCGDKGCEDPRTSPGRTGVQHKLSTDYCRGTAACSIPTPLLTKYHK